MKPQPSLIPRFNNDYTFNNFVYGIKSVLFPTNDNLSRLSSIFDNKNIFFTNSGRTSLYVILRALNLPKNSKIGVPLYSCTVVFDAIIKAGYIPCFIDVDLNNYTIDLKDFEAKIDKLSAVVVIHTFGRPADMDEIKEIANGRPVIEDCAHSMLSEYKGKKTGTIGTASLFSLGKYISAGGGGMILLNDNKFKDNLKREIDLLKSPTIVSEIKHSFMVYIFSFLYHKPWFGSFAFQIGSIIDKKVDINDKKGFKATKIKKNDQSIFIQKLEKFGGNMELQRLKSLILLEGLQNTDLSLPYNRKSTRGNYFLFPILFYDKIKRDKACNFLRNMGVDTAKLYNMTPTIARQHYGYKSDCPNTEKLADTVLIIPNYYNLTEDELLKIINVVKMVGG